MIEKQKDNAKIIILTKERRYSIERKIGEDENYHIYEGSRNIISTLDNDACLSRRYRIYILKKNAEVLNFFAGLQNIRDEVRLLSYIYHKNCPYIEDAGEIEIHGYRSFFIVEHWWDGISLRKVMLLLKERGKFERVLKMPIGIALWTVREMADALDYIHNLKDERGDEIKIFHRNLKPENIYYTKEGRVILTGFSLSKSEINLHTTIAGEIKGISAYTAPERLIQKEGINYAKADIFSLGCILYEMIVGIPRMRVNTAGLPEIDSLKRKINIHNLRENIHPQLEKLMFRMTEAEVEKRINSAEEVRNEIDNLLEMPPYRCFVGDVNGFIDYALRRNKNSYLSIQTLIDREKKLITKQGTKKVAVLDRSMIEKNSPSKEAKLTIPTAPISQKKDLYPTQQYTNNTLVEKKSQLNPEQWEELQKKIDNILQSNKTKHIDKTKIMQVIIIGMILFLFIIGLMLIINIYQSKIKPLSGNSDGIKAEKKLYSDYISMVDTLKVSSQAISDNQLANAIIKIEILDNGNYIVQFESIEGIKKEAENDIIEKIYKKINMIDWQEYKGKKFLLKLKLISI